MGTRSTGKKDLINGIKNFDSKQFNTAIHHKPGDSYAKKGAKRIV